MRCLRCQAENPAGTRFCGQCAAPLSVVCESCGAKTCIEICSGEAIHVNAELPAGAPAFDREKCIHCGVCLWNCDKSNIAFCAAPGGLHSAEN